MRGLCGSLFKNDILSSPKKKCSQPVDSNLALIILSQVTQHISRFNCHSIKKQNYFSHNLICIEQQLRLILRWGWAELGTQNCLHSLLLPRPPLLHKTIRITQNFRGSQIFRDLRQVLLLFKIIMSIKIWKSAQVKFCEFVFLSFYHTRRQDWLAYLWDWACISWQRLFLKTISQPPKKNPRRCPKIHSSIPQFSRSEWSSDQRSERGQRQMLATKS